MSKYHKVKQTKYIWLNSDEGTVVKSSPAGRRLEFEWNNIPPLNMSINATVSCVGVNNSQSVDANHSGTYRLKQIPQHQSYETKQGLYPIIHMIKSPNSLSVETEPIKYNIGDASRWTTINLQIGKVDDPSYGVRTQGVGTDTNSQFFILGLKFEDYDIEEVQPQLMPSIKDYHKYPQDRLQQKYI